MGPISTFIKNKYTVPPLHVLNTIVSVQVVEMMVTLYSVCHLVHADLSEYNILWWQKEAWFIDVSQAVEPIHPSGLDFLLRDCTNIINFFSKKGLQVIDRAEIKQ